MRLEDIYAPVKEDLAEVERNLIDTAGVDTPFLAQLLKHILGNEGKRIRPALTLLAGKFYDYEPRLLIPVATGMELLHTATLVHDDTLDNSVSRRGRPTISSLWGGKRAILVGDYLFAKAAAFVANAENMRVIKLFAQALVTISDGELQHSAADFNLRQRREHYYHWIGAKTACLFSAAAEAGAILSRAPEASISALRNYGYNLGMVFQLVDDILDFTGEEAEIGKPVGADLSQGILTLPAILFLERYPYMRIVVGILGKKAAEGLKQVIERIRQPAIIDECFDIASSFCTKAVAALEILPNNNIRQALSNLVDYCLRRQK